MRIFAIVILLAAALGCVGLSPMLSSECDRICGKPYRCSIARPEDPRTAQIKRLATDDAPAVDFSLSWSGVICVVSYVNRERPELSFTIGVKNPRPTIETAPTAPEDGSNE